MIIPVLLATRMLRHAHDTHGAKVGCGQMGSTLMGPLQKYQFCQIGEKGTPWHFWEDESRLTGIPKNVPLSKTMKFAATPLVLTPFVPFRKRFQANAVPAAAATVS